MSSLSAQAASLSKQAKSLNSVTHCIVFVIVLNCLLLVLTAYAVLTEHYQRWRRNKAAQALTEGYKKLKHRVSKTSKDIKTFSAKKKKSKSKSKSKSKPKSKSKSKSVSKSKSKSKSSKKDKKDKSKGKSKDKSKSQSTSKRRRKVRLDSDRDPPQSSQPKEIAKLKNLPTGEVQALPSPLRSSKRKSNVPPGSHVVFMGVSEGHDNATAPWFTDVQTVFPAGKGAPQGGSISATARSDVSASSKQDHPSKCPGTDSFGTQISSFSTMSQNSAASNGSVAIQMPLGPPSHEALRAGAFMNHQNVPTSEMPAHLIPAPPPGSASARVYQPSEVPSQFATDGVTTAIADSATNAKTKTAVTPTAISTGSSNVTGSTTNSSFTGTGTGTGTGTTTTPSTSTGSVLSSMTGTTTHDSYLVKSNTSKDSGELQVDVTQRESLADVAAKVDEKKKKNASKISDPKKSDSKPASEPKSDPKSGDTRKYFDA